MSALFEPSNWQLAHGKSLHLANRGNLMGVLNATPDSFSDGGQFDAPKAAAAHAARLFADGATIIDIGAESTRPGAAKVDAADEQARLLPALVAVKAALPDIAISADTYRASTAELALQNGAHIINDVWGLQREPDIARIAKDYNAGLVIMHTNRERDALEDVIEDQKMFFGKSLEIAQKAGIDEKHIVLDPGFGFGKETPALNFALMARLDELHSLGLPLLVGTSRKRFLGSSTGRDAAERDVATAATTALLRQKGVAIFRVHDVAINADALNICDDMLEQNV